ncbi:hypothetical protein [Rariglobus hedericola]|uniref:Uncharacterized protein n=1 Tax=Rariglobus hedericola TaxID=2597822 RepID=A0A556QIX1_9BACT|nr:hypothetical protein [Rariglobus hedericola]TSJ76590.1 hypothetical protein FPL22_10695 [Rariglobus hedericola]
MRLSALLSWSTLLLAGVTHVAAVTETRLLAGTVTNTTHDVTAPVKMELIITDDGKITGWLVVEAPLQAGRWPLTGSRKGAWCEVTCKQSADTATQFRGALSATVFRGTYIFGGKGELVQYGRFQASLIPQ